MMTVSSSFLLGHAPSCPSLRPRVAPSWRTGRVGHRAPPHTCHSRRPLAAAAGGMNQSLMQQKAKKEELRAKCEQAMDALVEEIRSAASTGKTLEATEAAPESSEGLRERILRAIELMSKGLVERDVEVRLLLLAALSGEHVLYIGPPGTAKSELGRRLSRVTRGVFFERLLTRFSVPEEIFGPLSMRALEEDRYCRITDGYLPQATVAFVDEIFKANSAILNTLLTILNERLFDNGSERVRVPLLCMVGASNELPESEELDALYDRFLFRKAVCQVSPGGLAEMLRQSVDAGFSEESGLEEVPLDEEVFRRVRAEALRTVQVPKAILDLIGDLRQHLQEKCEPPVYVSDRRLVKAVNALRVAAYCDGRTTVEEGDCLLLQHVLWQRPEEAERIYDFIIKQLSEGEDNRTQIKYILASLFGKACRLSEADRVSPGRPDLTRLLEEVRIVKSVLSDKLLRVYRGANADAAATHQSLWASEDVARAVASALLPKLERSRADVERLMFDTVTLETALVECAAPVTLAELLPKYWADFIRSGPIEDVSPLGLK